MQLTALSNGKQENLWDRVEGRLLAMLEGEPNLSLGQLDVATQAWVTQEYHRTVHSELGTVSLEGRASSCRRASVT